MATAATERTLRAILQYGIDPRGVREVKTGTGELEDSLAELQNALQESGMATEDLEEMFESLGFTLDRMSHEDAPVLKQALESVWEQFKDGKLNIQQVDQALGELQQSFRQITVFEELQEQLGKLRQQTFQAVEQFQDLGMVVSQWEAIGFEFADVGRRITDTIQGWAEQYIRVAGETDEVSRMWLDTTEELEAAQARLGAVAIRSLVPLMEMTATVVEKAADIAEKYPELMQIALGIGTAVVMATALQSAVSKGIRLWVDAKAAIIYTQQLLAAKMMRDAANKQLAAAAGMKAGAAGGAAGGGVRGLIGGAAGALGGAAPALAVGAAVVAVGVAGIAIKRFADDVGEKTEEMGDHWTTFIEDTSSSVENATSFANRYTAAQERVNAAYEKGGLVAKVFLDRDELVNANREHMQQTLVSVANDYADYADAVRSLNADLGDSEKAFKLVTKTAFDHRREMTRLDEQLQKGEISLRQYAKAVGGLRGAFMEMQAMILETVVAVDRLMDPWQEYLNTMSEAVQILGDDSIAAQAEYDVALRDLAITSGEERTRIAQENAAALLRLELETGAQREAALERQGAAMVQTETEIAQERTMSMESYQAEMADMEDSYYKDRAEAAEAHGLDVARAEADHQKQMRRMAEDSKERQRSAIRARDATGLLEERRSYDKDRGRAEEDHRDDMARRSEDFALQLAQMEQAFREQQVARERAFTEQLAALEIRMREEQNIQSTAAEDELVAIEEARVQELRGLHDHNQETETAHKDSRDKQKQELDRSLDEQLSLARQSYNQSIQDAESNWTQQRQAQGVFMAGELQELQSHYTDRLRLLQGWMQQANVVIRPPGALGLPGRQAGGYMGRGTYSVGEAGEEFALSHQTTRRAEQLAGGGLSQERLLALMGRGGGASISLQQTVQIGSANDPVRIAAIVRRETLTVLEEVVRGLN